MPAEYAFDQLIDILNNLFKMSMDQLANGLLRSIEIQSICTQQDFRTPAEEIVRLLMYPNVHSFFSGRSKLKFIL